MTLRENGIGNRERMGFVLAAIIVLFLVLTAAPLYATVEDPFADEVVNYAPGPGWYNYSGSIWIHPENALDAPLGKYVNEPYYTDTDTPVVTLGDGGTITLKFDTPVADNPHNPYGLDFIVFSNAVFVGGSPQLRWQELAFVEISQDGVNWYLIKPSILPAELRVNDDTGTNAHDYDCGRSYTAVNGYAEYTPTVGLPQELKYPVFSGVNRTSEELYTIPDRPSIPGDDSVTSTIDFDYVSGGGDAFDIANAVVETAPGVPLFVDNQIVPAGISSFNYIRLTDTCTGDSWPGLGEISAEIDAVSRTRPALSIGEIKKLPAGDYGFTTEAIITAVLTDAFFIESPDRSAAMKVEWDSSQLVNDDRAVTVGDKVTITGHLSKSAGCFTFPDPMFSFTSTDNTLPNPVGSPIKNLSTGLLYGMRVRTWGKVIDPGNGLGFTIQDGSDSLAVTCEAGCPIQTSEAYVSVTGICDRDAVGKPVVMIADPYNDITTY